MSRRRSDVHEKSPAVPGGSAASRRALGRVVALGLSGALVTGVASATTSAATSAPSVTPGSALVTGTTSLPSHLARPGVAARYTWALAAPARLPDGTTNTLSSKAVGIDRSGRVAGYVVDASGTEKDSFHGSGGPGAWLESADQQFASGLHATAVAPNGIVAGGAASIEDAFAIWDRRGRVRVVSAPDSHYGPTPSALNSRGVVAGVLGGVKVSDLMYGTANASAVVPDSRGGNYRVTGISESGLAVGSRQQPHYRNDGHYPEGIVFTASGVKDVKTTKTSAVDAISPNGRYLVGRVGPDLWETDRGRMAWLSTSRSPVYLAGADGLHARAVTDAGVVAGSKNGRAVLWQNGRVADLNSRVRKLPTGWVLTDVVAINKSGALAVDATDGTGRSVSLKVSPNGR